MVGAKDQRLIDRLRELQMSSPDIQGSAIVSLDGLAIATLLKEGIEEDRVSAMSAAMLSLGDRISDELGRGNLNQVYIRGKEGHVILMSIGSDAVLTVMSRIDGKLGLILLEMQRACQDLDYLI